MVPKPEVKPRSGTFYVLLAAALFVFIETFTLLSPILLSLLLILLISLAVNPVISRMRSLKGGRKGPTGLVAATLLMVLALTGWAFFEPMKSSVGVIKSGPRKGRFLPNKMYKFSHLPQ
jgi:predicted PurR-regulated permease PerM